MLSRIDSFFTSLMLKSEESETISNTWLNPNIPMTRGMKETPPSRFRFPKLNRAPPEAPSIPIVERRTPIPAAISPLIGSSPSNQPMEVRAKKIKAATSAGPNFKPTSASSGPNMVRNMIPIVPPMKEAIFPEARDFPAMPFFVN
jgi:hypothetical protein